MSTTAEMSVEPTTEMTTEPTVEPTSEEIAGEIVDQLVEMTVSTQTDTDRVESVSSAPPRTLEEWRDFREAARNPTLLMPIARIFIEQVEADDAAGRPSAAARAAPIVGSRFDKETLLGKMIAYLKFPVGDIKKTPQRRYSYIRYSQWLRPGRARYTEMERAKMQYQKKVNKAIKARALFCMKKRPVAEPVLNPEAMPVEVAPIGDLQPFFDFLMQSHEIELTDRDWSVHLPTLSKFTGLKDLEEGQIEFTRGVYYRDGRIDLCKQVVGPDHIEALMESIRHNPNVKHFLLGNNIIGPTGAKAIADFIVSKHAPEIETWYIAGNRIDADGIAMISAALETDHHATALWLKRNPIMADGCTPLSRMLAVNTTLEVLDLFNCGIGDEGVINLFREIGGNITMKHLYIGANGLTHRAMPVLADYFQRLVSRGEIGLTGLKMVVNRIEDTGAKILAAGLTGYRHLKKFSIASNGLTAEGVAPLLEAVAGSPELVYVDIGHFKSTFDLGELPNQLGDAGIDAVLDFLSKTPAVRGLDLTNNGMTLDGLERVIEVLPKTSICFFEFAQYEQPLRPGMLERIKKATMENYLRVYGPDQVDQYTRHARINRNWDGVDTIDSVYRNRM